MDLLVVFDTINSNNFNFYLSSSNSNCRKYKIEAFNTDYTANLLLNSVITQT